MRKPVAAGVRGMIPATDFKTTTRELIAGDAPGSYSAMALLRHHSDAIQRSEYARSSILCRVSCRAPLRPRDSKTFPTISRADGCRRSS